MFENGKLKRLPSEKTIHFHKAVGTNVTYKYPYSDKYNAGGVYGLVDGLTGAIYYNDGYWQGFHGDDMELVIDLGQPQKINSISVNFLQKMPTWIFMPEYVRFFASQDGESFEEIAEIMNTVPPEKKDALIREFKQSFPEITARYIKVFARNIGKCPDWHSGAGQPAWIFADEIVIN
jgi:hexosaminidase